MEKKWDCVCFGTVAYNTGSACQWLNATKLDTNDFKIVYDNEGNLKIFFRSEDPTALKIKS